MKKMQSTIIGRVIQLITGQTPSTMRVPFNIEFYCFVMTFSWSLDTAFITFANNLASILTIKVIIIATSNKL